MPLFEVDNLWVRFPTPDGVVEAVRGVSFAVEPGETLGIVGESGSGKTLATQAAFGLAAGAQVEGRAIFDRRDLVQMSVKERRAILGDQVGMVFQNPLSSMHPMYRVGWQLAEAIRAHDRSASKKAVRARVIDLLHLVGIPQPERRVDDFPHQFSGGMRQRAMIAMAIALGPALLIADEPTTAVDVTIQSQILQVLRELKEPARHRDRDDHPRPRGDRPARRPGGRPLRRSGDGAGVSSRAVLRDIIIPTPRASSSHCPRLTSGGASLSRSRVSRRVRSIPRPAARSLRAARTGWSICVVEQPRLEPVSGHPGHSSACFLPKGPASRGQLSDRFAVETAKGDETRG